MFSGQSLDKSNYESTETHRKEIIKFTNTRTFGRGGNLFSGSLCRVVVCSSESSSHKVRVLSSCVSNGHRVGVVHLFFVDSNFLSPCEKLRSAFFGRLTENGNFALPGSGGYVKKSAVDQRTEPYSIQFPTAGILFDAKPKVAKKWFEDDEPE